jgi:hypothetical protein
VTKSRPYRPSEDHGTNEAVLPDTSEACGGAAPGLVSPLIALKLSFAPSISTFATKPCRTKIVRTVTAAAPEIRAAGAGIQRPRNRPIARASARSSRAIDRNAAKMTAARTGTPRYAQPAGGSRSIST